MKQFLSSLVLIPVVSGFIVVSPTSAQQAGSCFCPRTASQSIADDTACTACSGGSACGQAKCSVIETTGEGSTARKLTCAWDPPNDFCASPCRNGSGWMVHIDCPPEADQGTCSNQQCIEIKIGYNGPLVAGPDVKIKDCKKRP